MSWLNQQLKVDGISIGNLDDLADGQAIGRLLCT